MGKHEHNLIFIAFSYVFIKKGTRTFKSTYNDNFHSSIFLFFFHIIIFRSKENIRGNITLQL